MNTGIISYRFPAIIRTAVGARIRKDASIPFNTRLICRSVAPIDMPMTTHIVYADRQAERGIFIKNIGITSIAPAMAPKRKPFLILFILIKIIPVLLATS